MMVQDSVSAVSSCAIQSNQNYTEWYPGSNLNKLMLSIHICLDDELRRKQHPKSSALWKDATSGMTS